MNWKKTHSRPDISTMLLTFVAVTKISEYECAYSDNRVRVRKTTVEYRGTDGNIYVKVFETKPGIDAVVPESGSNSVLTASRRQW